MIDPSSRYATVGSTLYSDAQGQQIAYLRRRFLPQGATLPLLTEVVVQDRDRLDLIAAHTLGVPEQFWRICDANNAMNPFDLTNEAGRILRVAQPQFQKPS